MYFNGECSQWNGIKKIYLFNDFEKFVDEKSWYGKIPAKVVHGIDGDVPLG